MQAADTIESVVTTVRSKTADPLVGIARWVVFGLLSALVGLTALVLLVAGAVRALDAYLPRSVFGDRHVWVAYLIIGGILAIAGLLLFAKSRPADDRR